MQNNFFGSKLNTVLLLILIVLMVFALQIMLKNKATYLPVLENEISEVSINQEQEDIIKNPELWEEYKNDLLGISFSYPKECGDMKESDYSISSIFIRPTNYTGCPLDHVAVVSKAESGENECPSPEPFINSGNYINSHSTEMFLSFGWNGICDIGIGNILALINFKHENLEKLENFVPVVSFTSKYSDSESIKNFMRILESVKLD